MDTSTFWLETPKQRVGIDAIPGQALKRSEIKYLAWLESWLIQIMWSPLFPSTSHHFDLDVINK